MQRVRCQRMFERRCSEIPRFNLYGIYHDEGKVRASYAFFEFRLLRCVHSWLRCLREFQMCQTRETQATMGQEARDPRSLFAFYRVCSGGGSLRFQQFSRRLGLLTPAGGRAYLHLLFFSAFFFVIGDRTAAPRQNQLCARMSLLASKVLELSCRHLQILSTFQVYA